jgi:hypothetical protein
MGRAGSRKPASFLSNPSGELPQSLPANGSTLGRFFDRPIEFDGEILSGADLLDLAAKW